MRMIEALYPFRYAQQERAVGDQFSAEVQHARGLVAARKAKYVEGEAAAAAPKRGPGRPKKSEAA